jgi:hypothetical protein
MSDSNLPTAAMDVDEAAIDEGLYSRQLCALSLCECAGVYLTVHLAMCLGTKVGTQHALTQKMLIVTRSDEEDGGEQRAHRRRTGSRRRDRCAGCMPVC